MRDLDATSERLSALRPCYFYGVSSRPPSEIVLQQTALSSLFSLIQAAGVISTPTLIDPTLIINVKGVTIWGLLYVVVYHQDRAALSAVAHNRAQIFVPENAVRASFASHINWPPALLQEYPLDLQAGFFFVLPFLVHESSPRLKALVESLKSPDGSLEIFGHAEFNENEPAELLERFSNLRAALSN